MNLTHWAVLIYRLESQIYNTIYVKYSEHLLSIVSHQPLSDLQTSLSFHESSSPYNDWLELTEENVGRGFDGENISWRGV